MTPDQIKKFIYYRQNPIAWIRDNVTITHRAKGTIPFNMYPFQENAINLMLAKKTVICLKSRQVGMSTIMQGFSLWCALHYADFRILILSTGMKAATRFLGDIKGMYERLPEDKKLKILSDDIGEKKKKRTVNNKTEIEFENGSIITALPATSSAARGASINLLIIDEAAFIRNIFETYTAIFPTLSRSFTTNSDKPSGLIVISTPNGISNIGKWYYDTYTNAVDKKNRFVPMRIHWSEVDEYDENWYIEQCSALNWNFQQIASELELSFLGSGNTYIPNKILDSVAIKEPIYKSLNSDLWIFKEPEPERKYVIGVDYAYGRGKDSSAIQVLDAITLEQVAEYLSNKVSTSDFAQVIAEVSEKYNQALTNIENNAGGKVLIEWLLEKYPNISTRLYRDSRSGDIIGETPKFGKFLIQKNTDIGTAVTGTTRDVILSNMYTIVLENYISKMKDFDGMEENIEELKKKFLEAKLTGRNKENINKVHGMINSERLLLQLLGFVVDKGGKAQGKKDDAVLSFAHALYAWTKSKKYLLNNAINIIEQFDTITPQLELERKYNSQLIKNINPGKTDKEIDYFLTALDDITEEDNLEENKRFSIWQAFI